MKKNKKQIYQGKIEPLIDRITGICAKYGINYIACFEVPTVTQPSLSAVHAAISGPSERLRAAHVALTAGCDEAEPDEMPSPINRMPV